MITNTRKVYRVDGESYVPCPFCGQRGFPKSFIDQQLKGIYKSSMITAEQNDKLRVMIENNERLVKKWERNRKRDKRSAEYRALKKITEFLKHYDLVKK